MEIWEESSKQTESKKSSDLGNNTDQSVMPYGTKAKVHK